MKYITALIILLIGVFMGYKAPRGAAATPTLEQDRFTNLEYTQPLLTCRLDTNQNMESEFEKLRNYITTLINQNNFEDVGVYVKQINSGAWFGVNETHEFTSASLGKIALMMTFFKQAGTNVGTLNDTITNNGQYQDSLNIDENLSFVVGETKTVSELIETMITHSDNISTMFLRDYSSVRSFGLKDAIKRYFELDKNKLDPVASPKAYGKVFEVLYNSTFLTQRYSEQALFLMAQGNYDNGIAVGIEENVKLANKFGLRHHKEQNIVQLHDCGIVYVPDNPYIICVMTRGNNEEKQMRIIQEISRRVYQELKD